MLPAGQSLSGRVLATGEPVTSDGFAADERASAAARGAMSHIGPAVLFPLGAPGNVRGVLTVGRRHGATPFPPAEVEVAASFAAQAGVALELAASRADAAQLSLYEGGTGSPATCTTWSSSGSTPPVCRSRARCR